MAIVKGAGLVMKAIIEVSLSGGEVVYSVNNFMKVGLSLVFMLYGDNQSVFV